MPVLVAWQQHSMGFRYCIHCVCLLYTLLSVIFSSCLVLLLDRPM